MINRITHLLSPVDMPNTPDQPDRHLRLMSDEDIQQLIKSRDTSGNINMLHPLELFLNKEYLTDVVWASLKQMQSRDKRHETPQQRTAVESAIQQRIDFLSWLNGQPPEVYMALYPAEDDGLEDIEDLEELLSDDSNPELPF